MKDKYRGASISEVKLTNVSQDQLFTFKVKAEGILPDPENMKVDFVEEAQKRDQAIKKIKEQIDRYLDKHKIEKFVNHSSEL